jgi:hypothetical protein
MTDSADAEPETERLTYTPAQRKAILDLLYTASKAVEPMGIGSRQLYRRLKPRGRRGILSDVTDDQIIAEIEAILPLHPGRPRKLTERQRQKEEQRLYEERVNRARELWHDYGEASLAHIERLEYDPHSTERRYDVLRAKLRRAQLADAIARPFRRKPGEKAEDRDCGPFIAGLAAIWRFATGQRATAWYNRTKRTFSPFMEFVFKCIEPVDKNPPKHGLVSQAQKQLTEDRSTEI